MLNQIQRSQGIDTKSGAGQKTSTAQFNAASFAHSFSRDEKGSVAIIFALTSFIVIALIGGAVDYGRALTARDQIQNAVDASVLAAARVWQTENDLAMAEAKGLEFYEKNKPQNVTSAVSGFTSDIVRNAIVMEASADVPAPFLTAAVGTYMRQSVEFKNFTVYARSEALLAVGGNSETNLEISMMLDITGSMSGQKIEDLKDAAKDLIDIVVWDDQSEYTSKVALVPFANAVQFSSEALVDQLRGETKATYCRSSSSPCTGVGSGNTKWSWGRPAKYYEFTDNDGKKDKRQVSSWCVTERTGAHKYTDQAPDSDAAKVGPLYGSTSANSCGGMHRDSSDIERNTVQPLSSDKVLLKRRIEKLKEDGSTAGQIGTAWAWYMLSPNWGSLWPVASRPKPYFTEKTQKIAILMTDGVYNTAHCNGVLAKDSGYGADGDQINCNATNAISDTQADQLCTAMKTNTGITVYTVGFALGGNNTAITTLRNCASDTSKFYEAEDGDALRMAFRDIALQIAKLRLSQ